MSNFCFYLQEGSKNVEKIFLDSRKLIAEVNFLNIPKNRNVHIIRTLFDGQKSRKVLYELFLFKAKFYKSSFSIAMNFGNLFPNMLLF
jgi:hypothetical protein